MGTEQKGLKTFKKCYIEITNACNLACAFCPQTRRQAQFMKVETFSLILDQIRPHTDSIYLHVKGEPLLHPKLNELLDISFDKGFKVNMTTNGTLIKKAKHNILGKPALRQINVSLHSFDGHAGSGDMEEYIGAILSFAREAVRDSGVFISLRLWNLDMDNAANLQRNRNGKILEIIEKEFGLNYKIEEKVVPGSGVKLAERIFLNQDHEFQWPDLSAAEVGASGFCHGLRTQAAVLVDGTVVPCCLDGEGVIDLGNINSSNFSEIIEGERANNLFNGFTRREAVEELCRKCGYRTRFNL